MIQLYPHPAMMVDDHPLGVDQADEVVIADTLAEVGTENRPGRRHQPWVFTNMIAAADGATALGGLSGGLGSDGDRSMFRALRSQADLILVGAATAEAEKYRPPIAYAEAQEQRLRRAQRPRPRLALVSNSLKIDLDLPLFDEEADNRPLIITSRKSCDTAPPELAERAELVASGSERAHLATAVQLLGERGYERILCEGGPSVNGQLISAGVVNEWNMTIAPLLAGGQSKRAAVGPLPDGPPPNMTLSRVWLEEHFLFCRWVEEC